MRVALCCLMLGAWGCKNDQGFTSSSGNVGIGDPPDPINPVQVDRIVQVSKPSVDILFVIDNSCSMEEEQAYLAGNFQSFLSYFLVSGLDYHIGVVSTDMNHPNHSGKLQARSGYRYIDSETPNAAQVFAQMAQLGTLGSGWERGRDAVFTAIDLRRDQPSNEGFYRHGAALDVIFVSDEDDVSELITRAEFHQWLDGLKWSPEMVTLHSIVAPNLFGDCSVAFSVGTEYLASSAYTGGQTFSICETNWEPMLDTLGLEASGLKREYFLTKVPVIDSLEVEVVLESDEGRVTVEFVTCGPEDELAVPDCEVLYVPTRNSVVFLEYIPDPGAEVVATYFIQAEYAAAPDALDMPAQ